RPGRGAGGRSPRWAPTSPPSRRARAAPTPARRPALPGGGRWPPAPPRGNHRLPLARLRFRPSEWGLSGGPRALRVRLPGPRRRRGDPRRAPLTTKRTRSPAGAPPSGPASLDDDDVDARLSRLDREHAVAGAGQASGDVARRRIVVDHDPEPRPRGQRLEGEPGLEESVRTLLPPEVQLRG